MLIAFVFVRRFLRSVAVPTRTTVATRTAPLSTRTYPYRPRSCCWPKGAGTSSSSRFLRTHKFDALCICKCTPDGNVAQVLLVAADQSGDGRGLILPAEWEGLSVTFLRGVRVLLRLAFGSGNRSVQPVGMVHH